MSKQEQAVKIVQANASKTRKEIISIIIEQLGMTDAGASTYYYNATKKIAALKADPIAGAVKEAEAEVKAEEKPARVRPSRSKAAKVEEKELEAAGIANSELIEEINEMINKIDGDDIPDFLKKGIFA